MKAGCFIKGLLLVLMTTVGYAQPPATAFQLTNLPTQGVLVNQGWRFHPGDNPGWAKPGLDDSRWKSIDPTKAIEDLPQVQRAGISWLRLHITTGPNLPPVLAYMFQSVASDVYLDGRLLYRFGTISTDPDSVRAYNPYAAFSLPLRPATQHVVAMRIAYQPGIDYAKSYLGRQPSVVRFNFFPAAEIPAIPIFNIESVYLDTFKIGICFILLVLHLSLFIAYRQQLANLYAAVMYLLMLVQFVLRAAYDLMHSVEARMVLHYFTVLSPWITGLMVLIFYSVFNLRKGWPFWLVIGGIAMTLLPIPAEYNWLSVLFSYYIPLELLRISVLATKRKLLGARIVTIGVLCNLGLSVLNYLVVITYKLPILGNEWLFHLIFNLSFLCIPLALSLRLSLEHGWVSRQLSLKLQEVEDLSARNLAQQQYRQRLLAEQNEHLEQQVDERTKELRQQANRLRELDEVKSRFVTNLTHEFRTPLSLIISPVAKLLESPTLSHDVQGPLQTVDRNARHLLNQVNQLLDIARIEDGRMHLTLQPVRLGQLTAQLVDLFSSAAEADQINMLVSSSGDDRPCLMDTDKWGKIVYNLLANALKFTPAGGRVRVGLVLEDDQAQLTVQDTGIGIAADKVPFIFDRFYQVDDNTTRSFEGTGVGLALVRELTNLLGGQVSVKSQLGEGSTFTVRLPLEAASPTSPLITEPLQLSVAVQPTPKTKPDFAEEVALGAVDDDRALVLVAEDNADLCQFMADELSARYRVLTAHNGEQGWELTQQHLPDVVISDVMMPRMGGLQLTSLIKNSATTDHIAVVLLTARGSHDNRLEGLQAGADDYLVKPFDLAELRLRLGNLMTRRLKLQAYYRLQLTQPIMEPEVITTGPDDPFLEHIYSLLESHLDNPQLGVEWLADQLSMDRKTLYRKLQSKIQLSPNALIRTYRLRRGRELLQSGKTVTETAYTVGFESVTYFGHCFKEQYQMTPTEFISRTV
ncbi:ATP-binding protein [Spirosoma arcticum]